MKTVLKMGDSKKDKAGNKAKSTGVNSNVLEPVTNEQILKKLDNLTNVVQNNAKSCDEAFEANRFVQNEIADKLAVIVGQFDEMKGEFSMLKKENAKLKKMVNSLSEKIQSYDDKFESIDREGKRNNLCIDGILEKEGLNLPKMMNDLFVDLGLNYRAEDVCKSIYRKGKVMEGSDGPNVTYKPRPVIVVFDKPFMKKEIFGNLKKLNGNNRWQNIFINDDLTTDQIGKMKDLRAVNAYAKSLGKNSKVKGTNLFLEGEKFTLDDVYNVPEEVSIVKAKNIEVDNGSGIVFQGHHSFCSNMHSVDVEFEGKLFHTSEVAYQFKRAEDNGCTEIAKKIRHLRDPYKAKRMSKKVKETPEWSKKKEKVMKAIVEAKFNQNEEMKKKLVDTKEKVLCEGTGDKFWGCGTSISQAQTVKVKKLQGKNTLGNILMAVRKVMLGKKE